MSSADSVKNRLYNKAKTTGKTMQEMLIMYCLERTLYTLSISKYSNNFTLKGGVLLYALFDGAYARTTGDVDLLAEKISFESCQLCHIEKLTFCIHSQNVFFLTINII